MAQEFSINSSALESKINQLLPSQGGFGAGVDLSASTQIIPIVDLTESAEGSNVRADLQTAFSFKTVSAFNIINTTTTIINTTGYFRIFGVAALFGTGDVNFNITDGISTKLFKQYIGATGSTNNNFFDFIMFVEAGVSINIRSTSANVRSSGCTRQIADINGNFTDP